jgi:hypothetical protein
MVDELLRHVHEHLSEADPDLPSIHRAAISEDAAALGAAAMSTAAALMLGSADPAQRTRQPLHMAEPLAAPGVDDGELQAGSRPNSAGDRTRSASV